MFKAIIQQLLERQTKRLLKQHRPRIVAVAGSVGKTSTKHFIATVLSQHFRVMAHEGNYNSELSIPLSIFAIDLPQQLKNPFAWLAVLLYMRRKIKRPFNYDVIVLELGTNKPGDIVRFKRYLKPDIAIVSAVSAEHMQSFKTLDAVAREELMVASFSDMTLLNHDDIDPQFVRYAHSQQLHDYGLKPEAQYRYAIENYKPGRGFTGKFISSEYGALDVPLELIGEHNVRSAVAAGAVSIRLGLSAGEVAAGMVRIRPVAGRMQLLEGFEGSLLIDDTYNSSPQAAIAALNTLYTFPSEQRIAILGSMNELGDASRQAHEEVGLNCDPAKLDCVITIGAEAEQYLAPTVASRGCQVKSFTSPYEAGAFVHKILRPGAVVLAKGSQDGIFAEEALKVLLADGEDVHRLVRQSPQWLATKQRLFDSSQADNVAVSNTAPQPPIA